MYLLIALLTGLMAVNTAKEVREPFRLSFDAGLASTGGVAPVTNTGVRYAVGREGLGAEFVKATVLSCSPEAHYVPNQSALSLLHATKSSRIFVSGFDLNRVKIDTTSEKGAELIASTSQPVNEVVTKPNTAIATPQKLYPDA